MDGQIRENIKIGAEVDIVLNADQRTGKLTNSTFHPRGIKVCLEDGQVGRVQKVYPAFPKINGQEYIEGLT